MGEYHKLNNGSEIKVGTCEDLYYLRADQFGLLSHKEGAGDLPNSIRKCGEVGYRFRFPFPDEDGITPGQFEDFRRSVGVPGFELDEMFSHNAIAYANAAKFEGAPGGAFSVLLPCPFAGDYDGPKVTVKGMDFRVSIIQQKAVEDELWTVVKCASCNAAWRLSYDHAERLAVALRSGADKFPEGDETARRMHLTADRVLAGYAAGKVVAGEFA